MKLRIFKYKLFTESRSLHSGMGHTMGCGYDFEGRYLVLTKNGVVLREQILKLVYGLNLEQIKRHSDQVTRLRNLELKNKEE